MPKVSIIMNCYNSDKYLKEAIDSIYEQTYQDWEIIFWDNQSTDNSASIAKSYDERVKYFYADEHLPIILARNKSFEKATGEYIAILDCDDLWFPDKLKRQIDLFNNNKHIDFIYSNFFIKDTRVNRRKIAHKNLQPEENIFEYQITNYSIGFLTVMFKTELLSKVDEWFDLNLRYAGEYDLFLRFFRQLRIKVSYIKEPLAVYRVHGNNATLVFTENNINDFRYLAQKFTKLYDKNDKYVQEGIKMLTRRADIIEATVYLSSGEQKNAADLLWKHRFYNIETWVQYILSLLPSRISIFLYNFIKK